MNPGQAGGRPQCWVPPGPAWLFCPADRPERYEKASARADVVIVDLEDAVGAADKAAARESVIATPLDPARTIVRVNAHGTDDQAADLEALKQTEYTTVMLPKCESVEQIAALAPLNVVALIESPLGAMTVFDALAADNAIGAMWGAEDLVAAMGGNSSRHANGEYRAVAQQVRSQTLLAAKARGLFALDSVYLDIPDLDGVRTEADDAVAIGFDGKVAIHPSHIPVIRGAYAPSPEDLEWATAVLDAVSHNRGVFTFREQMVDAPVLAHARRIIARRPPN